jgi:hypothetical protein
MPQSAMHTRSLRTQRLLPDDRAAELEAARRRAHAAMMEVNRLARPARLRAGLEYAPGLSTADWALAGVAAAAVAAFGVWLWRSGKQKAGGSGFDVLGVQ